MFSNFFSENCMVNELMSRNLVVQEKADGKVVERCTLDK
jgi:hypothetical protein